MIDTDRCAKLRAQYRDGDSVTTLAQRFDVSETTIGYHLRGACSHTVTTDTVDLTPSNSVSKQECLRMVEQAADRSARDIVEETGRSFSTVVAHLTGECRHDHEKAFDRASIYERISVSAEECARLRREYEDDQAVTSLAANVPWTYPTVLTHLNGECEHELDVEPRETRERNSVDAELCQQLRETYQGDSSLTIEDVAAQFEVATGTVERHIKYGCSHPARDGIRDLLETTGLDEYTDSPPEEESAGEDRAERPGPAAPSSASEEPAEPQQNDDASESATTHTMTSDGSGNQTVPNDAKMYHISPLAAQAVRRVAADTDCEAETAETVIRSAIKEHIKHTVDGLAANHTSIPERTESFAVDLEPQNEAFVESVSGEGGEYEAPSSFVEEAIRAKLDVPEATPTEVTIPGETAAMIEATVETGADAESVDAFVQDIVEQAVDDLSER